MGIGSSSTRSSGDPPPSLPAAGATLLILAPPIARYASPNGVYQVVLAVSTSFSLLLLLWVLRCLGVERMDCPGSDAHLLRVLAWTLLASLMLNTAFYNLAAVTAPFDSTAAAWFVLGAAMVAGIYMWSARDGRGVGVPQ